MDMYEALKNPEIYSELKKLGLRSNNPDFYDWVDEAFSDDTVKSATANCIGLSAQLTTLQTQVDNLNIHAPFDNLVATLTSEEMMLGREGLLKFLQEDLLVAHDTALPLISELALNFQQLSSSIVNLVTVTSETFGQMVENLSVSLALINTGLLAFIIRFTTSFGSFLNNNLALFNFFRQGLTTGWSSAWNSLQSITVERVNQIVGQITNLVNSAIGKINSFLNFVNSIGGAIGLNLNLQIPGFADGGWVGKTGLALVHQGEYVVSREMLAGREPMTFTQATREQNLTINAVINNEVDLVQLGQEILWQIQGSY